MFSSFIFLFPFLSFFRNLSFLCLYHSISISGYQVILRSFRLFYGIFYIIFLKKRPFFPYSKQYEKAVIFRISKLFLFLENLLILTKFSPLAQCTDFAALLTALRHNVKKNPASTRRAAKAVHRSSLRL